MRSRICSLFLTISLLATCPVLRAADKEDAPEAPLLGGVYVSADVFGFIYPIFITDAFYSMEASASVDIKHRFYPTVEAGYGYCNTTGDLYGIRYATAAPYVRVGMDYNMQYKTGAPNYILAGLRVATTSAPYEVEAASLVDPVFTTETPFHLVDMPCRALWAEAVVGVRAQIIGGFYMGWTIRYKRMLHMANDAAYGSPWYVPGFGVYGTEAVGATYNLTWYFNMGALHAASRKH